jgi:hypothetical protein
MSLNGLPSPSIGGLGIGSYVPDSTLAYLSLNLIRLVQQTDLVLL